MSWKSLRDSFPEHFGSEWERAQDIFYDAVRATHQVIRPLPERWRCWMRPRAHLQLGVVSSKAGAAVADRSGTSGMGWPLSCAGGGRRCRGGQALRRAAASGAVRMGLQAGSDIWYVGDTAIDMQAARAAGCVAVLLGDAAHDGGIAACAPDLAFAHGLELASQLRALDKRTYSTHSCRHTPM